MELELRPEVIGTSSLNLRKGSAFDVSSFKQHQDYQPFVQQEYEIRRAGTQQVRFDVPAGQDYLDDVAFWFKIDKELDVAVGGVKKFSPLDVPTALHKFIRSVEVKADGKQILYIDHARFLIDIMVKKKKNPDEHFVHKFEDYPLEYRRFYGHTDSVNLTQQTFVPESALQQNDDTNKKADTAADDISKESLTKKQLAIYRYIQNV